MRELFSQIAVVREDDQALAFHVEPAHVEKPAAVGGNEVEDGLAAALVGAGAEVAAGLVQQQ